MKRPLTFAPATLGSIAAAKIIRAIVWCKDCRHQVEPDMSAQAQHYGAATTIPDWSKRLVCSQCGSRNVDFVLTGARP
jgi:Zn finger protein HypA/HybF involved in hydrogenase expression